MLNRLNYSLSLHPLKSDVFLYIILLDSKNAHFSVRLHQSFCHWTDEIPTGELSGDLLRTSVSSLVPNIYTEDPYVY